MSSMFAVVCYLWGMYCLVVILAVFVFFVFVSSVLVERYAFAPRRHYAPGNTVYFVCLERTRMTQRKIERKSEERKSERKKKRRKKKQRNGKGYVMWGPHHHKPSKTKTWRTHSQKRKKQKLRQISYQTASPTFASFQVPFRQASFYVHMSGFGQQKPQNIRGFQQSRTEVFPERYGSYAIIPFLKQTSKRKTISWQRH